MSKILITFLGTGNYADARKNRGYQPVNYRFGGQEVNTPLISVALTEMIKPDKVIVAGTMRSAWEVLYFEMANAAGRFDEVDWQNIIEANEKSDFKTPPEADKFNAVLKFLPHGSQLLALKYGISQDELSYNFSELMKVGAMVDEGDEIYLDITHGFRSLPVFGVSVLSYLVQSSRKKVKPRGVYYGMIEATRELGYAPVVELTETFNMLNWSRAASDFSQYGDTTLLSELLGNDAAFGDLSKAARKWSVAINTNDWRSLYQSSKSLISATRATKGVVDVRHPLYYLSDDLIAGAKELTSVLQEWQRLVVLSKKQTRAQQYGLAVLSCWEAVIARMEQATGRSAADGKYHYNILSGIIEGRYQRTPLKKIDKEWFKKVETLKDIRNKIAHADVNTSQNPSDFEKVIPDLVNYFSRVLHSTRWQKFESNVYQKHFDLLPLHEGNEVVLLNSPVITAAGNYSYRPVSAHEARQLIDGATLRSYIGHETTAKFLSELLQTPIAYNRDRYEQKPGEKALVFRLLSRLPEGAVLGDLYNLEYELGLLELKYPSKNEKILAGN